MSTKILRKTVVREAYVAGGRVDRVAGIVYGVKIGGKKSKNNREYTSQALTDLAKLSNGSKGYIDHALPGRRIPNSPTRSMHDWACVFKNCTVKNDGVYGDAHCRMETAAGKAVMEAAEKFPDKFGLSQHSVVEAFVRQGDNCTVVERVIEVKSIDIVDNPATTTSLFEAIMDETVPAAPLSIEGAFLALQTAIMASSDHDDTERLAVLKDVMKLKAKVMGTDEEPDAASDAPADTQESVQAAAPKKGIRREMRELKVRQMVLSEGVQVEEAVITSMFDMSDEGVKALLATLKKGQRRAYGAQTPRTGGRKEVSEAVDAPVVKKFTVNDSKKLIDELQS